VSSNGGTTNGMPVQMGNPPPTPSGIMSANTDGNDFYFIVFSRNAASLLFGAYFGGGATGEHVDGGTSRFDKNRIV
jgi:predicted Zn-dependent protease